MAILTRRTGSLLFVLLVAQFVATTQNCSAQYQAKYLPRGLAQVDPAFGPANEVGFLDDFRRKSTIGPACSTCGPSIGQLAESSYRNRVALTVLAFAGLSFVLLLKRKKAAFWTLGGCVAALMAVSGFVWGLFAFG